MNATYSWHDYTTSERWARSYYNAVAPIGPRGTLLRMQQAAVIFHYSRRYRVFGEHSSGRPWPKGVETLEDMKKYIETVVRIES
jgi:hypothetical protein